MTNEAKTEAPVRYHCPHLGLNIDRTVMLSEATLEHRCFVTARPGAPDLAHQEHYCLTTHHRLCPLYQEPQPQEPALVLVDGLVLGGHRREESPSPLTNIGRAGSKWGRWLPVATVALVVIGILLVVVTRSMALVSRSERPLADAEPTIATVGEGGSTAGPTTIESAETATSPTESNLPAAENVGPAAVLTSTATPVPVALVLLPTVTPEPGAAVLKLAPVSNSVSWWSSGEKGRGHINDSFLYAGYLQGDTYISAMRFGLRQVSRGADIRRAQLRLTGLRADRLVRDPNAIWWVELLAEDALDTQRGADFLTVFSAPSSITLAPLRATDLNEGQVNSFELDPLAIAWLEQAVVAPRY